MKLIIAEKPSMAGEIAKSLSAGIVKKDGYYEARNNTVVTWLYGHILRQAEPDEYDPKYKAWRSDDLPIIPHKWKLCVSGEYKKQFAIIKKLLGEANEIIHAGDPDREGQLLVDEVLDHLSNKKPVQRLLLNALDEKSIKTAFAGLRNNSDFYHLNQAALARSRADWLTGMNLSRAYTLAAQKAGHRMTLSVGRVKTPTLALVVRRERELSAFRPVDYVDVKAVFKHVNGVFTASWKPKEGQPGLDKEGHLVDQEQAQGLFKRLQDCREAGFLSLYEISEKKDPHVLPFSLSALQILAGKKYKLGPQAVLDAVQDIYESKLVTYPRSDCNYLPEAQHSDARIILENIKSIKDDTLSAWAQKAQPGMKSRAWCDAKITAHHAIIPTTVKCNLNSLADVQKKVYFLIARAYIAQFYPLHTYSQTKAEVCYANEKFTATGKTINTAGWKELYGKEDKEETTVLPQMNSGDSVDFDTLLAEKKTTKPPSRFTSSTLLAAMKEIHKYVKNPELRSALKDVSGIGTEATRAGIINELITRGYLAEDKKQKYLTPTESANLIIDLLPDDITYPDSTALWEEKLEKIAGAKESLDSFLSLQHSYITAICREAANVKPSPKKQIACPECKTGNLVFKKGKRGGFWGCSAYPQCRATYNDSKGGPDFGAKNKK